jgi:hypothetical protein
VLLVSWYNRFMQVLVSWYNRFMQVKDLLRISSMMCNNDYSNNGKTNIMDYMEAWNNIIVIILY